MTDGVWIGLDIGGSKLQGVVIDATGAVLGQVRMPSSNGAAGITETAAEAIERLRALPAVAECPLLAVGVGVPGVVDTVTGHVSHAVNLDLGADGVALRDALSSRVGTTVVVENDVNAAALGAWHARRPTTSDLAYLSIGTGLAAGLVMNGRLHRGSRGAAGEIGHIPLDPAGPLCACGQHGCLEVLASGAAISRRWPAADGVNPAHALFDAAQRGDPAAVAVRDDVADQLASAVLLLVLTTDVDVVVLGGGVAELGPRLKAVVVSALQRREGRSAFLRALEVSARVDLVSGSRPVAALGAALAGQQAHEQEPAVLPITASDRSRGAAHILDAGRAVGD